MSENKNKKVGVVCATYRDLKKPSPVREFGLVSLVEQMFTQNYDGEIAISIVDSSVKPHSHLLKLSQKYPDKLIYNHVPDRLSVRDQDTEHDFIPSDEVLKKALKLLIARDAQAGQILSRSAMQIVNESDLQSVDESSFDVLIGRVEDGDFLSNDERDSFLRAVDVEGLEKDKNVAFWANRLSEMKDMAGFIPFEEDYPIQANIFSQIFMERPTIGMKKNYGIQALRDHGYEPEVIVFSDDDDLHSPNYVAQSVGALSDNDFTRMTRYLTHMVSAPEDAKDFEWGIFDLPVEKDSNGYWRLNNKAQSSPLFRRHPEGRIYEETLGKKFSRLVTMAWPILSHEGALHTYSYRIWEKSVSAFGGCAPVSFCEDIIYYRQLKNHFGSEFRDVHTGIEKGKESFVRISDGSNASIAEVTEKQDCNDLPEWAQRSAQKLHRYIRDRRFG